MNDTDYKKAFALALTRNPSDPFKAARTVFGSDTGRALEASSNWVLDSEVLAFKREIDEQEPGEFLPSKDEYARELLEYTRSLITPDYKLQGYKQYAEVMGYTQKGTVINNEVNKVTNNVMVVKESNSLEDYERKLKAQQTKLIEHATTRH